jgi:hypothetical protein
MICSVKPPRPVQQPRLPIWIGGGYPHRRPIERALRWDGACLYDPQHGPLSAEAVADLRGLAPDRPWTIAVGGSLGATTGTPSANTSRPSATLAPSGGSNGLSPPIVTRCDASSTGDRCASTERQP